MNHIHAHLSGGLGLAGLSLLLIAAHVNLNSVPVVAPTGSHAVLGFLGPAEMLRHVKARQIRAEEAIGMSVEMISDSF